MTRTDALIAAVKHELRAQETAINGAVNLTQIIVTVEILYGWKPTAPVVQFVCKAARSHVESKHTATLEN